MESDVNVPAEAVEAAKEQWRLVGELPTYEPRAGARGISDDYREGVDRDNNRAISTVLQAAAPAFRKQVREELQEAFDHILKVESKLPGLHDIFDRVFPGWEEGGETPDSHRGPLGDGPSFAHDVKPLEEELALAKAHPEYGIDVEAVEAALREAKADAAGKRDEHES